MNTAHLIDRAFARGFCVGLVVGLSIAVLVMWAWPDLVLLAGMVA